MGHRCTYGEELFKVYVGKVNSDQTEGRGGMRDHSVWATPEAAYAAIKGEGVMGVGDGDVHVRGYWTCDADDTGEKCDAILVRDFKIYDGYAARNKGRPVVGTTDYGTDGWRPDYSPLMKDPEYKEFLRLRRKFSPLDT